MNWRSRIKTGFQTISELGLSGLGDGQDVVRISISYSTFAAQALNLKDC